MQCSNGVLRLVKNQLGAFKEIVCLSSAQFNTSSILHSNNEPEKTTLYDLHVAKGGKMVNFGGFLLPVQYNDLSITASHLHTRENASLFDVSHMLQTEVEGEHCVEFMETICTADLKNLKDGSATLTVFTNENGGISDDLIITKINSNLLYVVSNAGRRKNDIELMQAALKKYKDNKKSSSLNVRHFTSNERSLLALQGPKAAEILQNVTDFNLKNLYFMQSTICTVAGVEPCRVTRCGYTGEDGFEISLPDIKAADVTEYLLEKHSDLKLAGLGARDSLRLEAGLCLYGNDINEQTTPIEAGLTWLVAKSRRETGGFPGYETIISQIKNGVDKKRVGIISQSGPPARAHTEIYNAEKSQKIGEVTSGCPSPSLKGQNIAMGYIENRFNKVGNIVALKIREKFYEAVISKMPFVKANYYSVKK